jgi:hypothetical protein
MASAVASQKLYAVIEDLTGRFSRDGSRGVVAGNMRADTILRDRWMEAKRAKKLVAVLFLLVVECLLQLLGEIQQSVWNGLLLDLGQEMSDLFADICSQCGFAASRSVHVLRHPDLWSPCLAWRS